MEQKKGLNDLVKKGNMHPEEKEKKLKEIDDLINNTPQVEETKSMLPILVVSLIIVVVFLLIIVNVLDHKVSKSSKNQIKILEIR